MIDYILIRKSGRKLIREVIRQEGCISSHKLIICVLYLKEGLNKRKMEFVKRCKVWKLRDDVTAGIFKERVQTRAALAVEKPTGVEEVWNNDNNNTSTFLSVSLHRRSISDVIVSTQHQTETTNLSLMLRPTIIKINSNKNPVNQSLAVQVILKGGGKDEF